MASSNPSQSSFTQFTATGTFTLGHAIYPAPGYGTFGSSVVTSGSITFTATVDGETVTGTETVTGPPATPVTFRNWSVCTASTPVSTGQMLAMDLTPLAYRATVSDGASPLEDAGGGKLAGAQGNVLEMSATSTGDTTAPSITPTTPIEGQPFGVTVS